MENVTTIKLQYPDFGALLESIKENGRRIDERDEHFRKEQAELYARWEAERKERDARWEAERKERDERWAVELEKDRAEFKERMNKISEDTNKAIKDMKNVFTTQWGRLVEALSKPAALALFKKEGIEIDRVYEEVHKLKKDGQDVMEIDVALCDTSVAVIVEVKTRCGRRDIDYFLSQMEHCKKWYPDFADKKLLVAVAAIQYDEGTAVYAQKLGLYVLQLSGEETFTMEVPKNPLAF